MLSHISIWWRFLFQWLIKEMLCWNLSQEKIICFLILEASLCILLQDLQLSMQANQQGLFLDLLGQLKALEDSKLSLLQKLTAQKSLWLIKQIWMDQSLKCWLIKLAQLLQNKCMSNCIHMPNSFNEHFVFINLNIFYSNILFLYIKNTLNDKYFG